MGIGKESIFWKWIETSSKVVPGRCIKWEFRIPYVFSIGGSLFCGFSIDIWLLFIHVHYITDVSCGRIIRFQRSKWYIGIMIHNGWAFYFDMGLSRGRYLDWRLKRTLRKMTPEKLIEYIDSLSGRLNKDEED